MKVFRKTIITAVIVSSFLLAFTVSAAAECIKLRSELIQTSCDPNNWCWFFWGQLEHYYNVQWDCDGDREMDVETIETEQGNCCKV